MQFHILLIIILQKGEKVQSCSFFYTEELLNMVLRAFSGLSGKGEKCKNRLLSSYHRAVSVI